MISINKPMKRILVPTDFSQLSNQALPIAEQMVAGSDVELHLLHAYRPEIAYAPSGGVALTSPTGMSATATNRQQMVDRLQQVPVSLEVSTKQVKRSVIDGSPATSIVDYAEVNGIDLIVMTTHGNTGLTRFLMGSVAETVVRTARCPVLTLSDQSSENAT